ncbi:hypothetical protein K504DRAFT_503301 [Pleomassaria siparia CBS 279.74]|uniref:Uncharacterized protein n=1 Tax=Pleomassaria siparia CBS 279.74 TaxID=1314801 RepID=A0A6G1K667_9PLEO|nr:hypothetical protein K504DRAFT_503301 [Pleomassaria siparia CBS 279.74]
MSASISHAKNPPIATLTPGSMSPRPRFLMSASISHAKNPPIATLTPGSMSPRPRFLMSASISHAKNPPIATLTIGSIAGTMISLPLRSSTKTSQCIFYCVEIRSSCGWNGTYSRPSCRRRRDSRVVLADPVHKPQSQNITPSWFRNRFQPTLNDHLADRSANIDPSTIQRIGLFQSPRTVGNEMLSSTQWLVGNNLTPEAGCHFDPRQAAWTIIMGLQLQTTPTLRTFNRDMPYPIDHPRSLLSTLFSQQILNLYPKAWYTDNGLVIAVARLPSRSIVTSRHLASQTTPKAAPHNDHFSAIRSFEGSKLQPYHQFTSPTSLCRQASPANRPISVAKLASPRLSSMASFCKQLQSHLLVKPATLPSRYCLPSYWQR